MGRVLTWFMGWVILTGTAYAQIPEPAASPLEELASRLKTPEALEHYLWKNFRFTEDRRQYGLDEYWQSPEEFLRNKAGDCEDFALFAHEILKKNGYGSFLLNIYGKRYAHTVAVIKEGGGYRIVDGTSLKRRKFHDLQELAASLYPFWKQIAFVGYDTQIHQGRILRQIERTN